MKIERLGCIATALVMALMVTGQVKANFLIDTWKPQMTMLQPPVGFGYGKLSRSQLEVRWPLRVESYALLTFLATACSWF